jgi:hypothetical protein
MPAARGSDTLQEPTPKALLRRWQGQCVDVREVITQLVSVAPDRGSVFRCLERLCYDKGTAPVGVLVAAPRVACVSFGSADSRRWGHAGGEIQMGLGLRGSSLVVSPAAVAAMEDRGQRWCAAHGAPPGRATPVRWLHIRSGGGFWGPYDAHGVLQAIERIFAVAEQEAAADPRLAAAKAAHRPIRPVQLFQRRRSIEVEATLCADLEQTARRRVARPALNDRLMSL